jgi:hypothetical protein
MGFDYLHLEEPDVRQAMASAWHAEWADLKANWPRDCCYGKQLTDQGWDAFERVMPEALSSRRLGKGISRPRWGAGWCFGCRLRSEKRELAFISVGEAGVVNKATLELRNVTT